MIEKEDDDITSFQAIMTKPLLKYTLMSIVLFVVVYLLYRTRPWLQVSF